MRFKCSWHQLYSVGHICEEGNAKERGKKSKHTNVKIVVQCDGIYHICRQQPKIEASLVRGMEVVIQGIYFFIWSPSKQSLCEVMMSPEAANKPSFRAVDSRIS